MHFQIDRSLPVTIAAQLQGQIEYGVAFGTIPHGTQLPSVRSLAAQLDVSPVTISHVYRELIARGVLLAEQGRGTFVARQSEVDPNTLAEVRLRIDRLIADAEAAGIPRPELQRLIAARIESPPASDDTLEILFVGNFQAASEKYARHLERYASPYLRDDETISVCTVEALTNGCSALGDARTADVVLTLAHRLPEVRAAVGDRPVLVVLDFVPSDDTLERLRQLPAHTRVALVSTYPQFLTPLKQKVLEAAPQVEVVVATTRDAVDLSGHAGALDVVVYTTGSDGSVEGVPAGVERIEFRYTPDPSSIERDFVSLLRLLRRHASPD